MSSVSDRESLPESHPLNQLSQLVHHLGEELATFRKRAMQAEATLRGFESASRSGDLFAEQRVVELEKENADLRARLDFATEQTRAILSQVRFLRQQAERPVTQAVVGNGESRVEKQGNRSARGGR